MVSHRSTAFALSTLLFLALPHRDVRAAEDDAKGVVMAREGSASLSDGDFDSAVRSFTAALDSGNLEPRMSVIVLMRRATAFQGLKQYDKALRDLEDAAKQDRDFGMRADNSGRKIAVMVVYNRGVVHESMASMPMPYGTTTTPSNAIRNFPGSTSIAATSIARKGVAGRRWKTTPPR